MISLFLHLKFEIYYRNWINSEQIIMMPCRGLSASVETMIHCR
jgi:hypothetical protein